jgi:hypothetical protein
MLPTGGNGDQLVRLANGGRLANGDRHRQHDLLFAGGTPRRIAYAISLAEADSVADLSLSGR